MDILDFTPLITKARGLNPDAIIQFSYPGDGIKSIEDMIAADYNPKLFYNSLGVTSSEAYTKFGSNLDGILYHSFAFPKSPKSKGRFGTGLELMETYIKKYGLAPDMVDGSIAYATIEVMGTLIERAGTPDKEAIYEEIVKTKNNPIPTIMGPMSWDRGPWPDLPGAVGQHIGTLDSSLGEDCEIVGAGFGEMAGIKRSWNPGEWTSHAPLYPKPAWKKK
jgi:branched-chain amino acid transport system substrate-binding protein